MYSVATEFLLHPESVVRVDAFQNISPSPVCPPSLFLPFALSPLFFSLPFAPLTEYLPRLDSHMFQDFFVSTDRSEGNLHPERLSPPDE